MEFLHSMYQLYAHVSVHVSSNQMKSCNIHKTIALDSCTAQLQIKHVKGVIITLVPYLLFNIPLFVCVVNEGSGGIHASTEVGLFA